MLPLQTSTFPVILTAVEIRRNKEEAQRRKRDEKGKKIKESNNYEMKNRNEKSQNENKMEERKEEKNTSILSFSLSRCFTYLLMYCVYLYGGRDRYVYRKKRNKYIEKQIFCDRKIFKVTCFLFYRKCLRK